MPFAGEWVVPGEDQRAEQHQPAHRGDQQADGEQGGGGLKEGESALWWGLVTRPAQDLQGEEHGEGGGDLAQEGARPVKDALLAAVGAQLVPLDDVGEDGIGQRVGGGDAHPGQRGDDQYQGHLSRPDEEQEQFHDQEQAHAEQVGLLFIPLAGEPHPEGQRKDAGGHENAKEGGFEGEGDAKQGHAGEQVAAGDPVEQEERGEHGDHVHGGPVEQVDAHGDAEGDVLPGHLQGLADGQGGEPGRRRLFADGQEDQEEGEDADAPEDGGDDDEALLLGEAAGDASLDDQRGSHDDGEGGGELEEGAEPGEGGAAVVIGSEFRGQREEGDRDEGGHRVEEHVGEEDVEHQAKLRLPVGCGPDEHKARSEGEGEKEQEGTPPAPAGAHPVTETTDEGIVDRIPEHAQQGGQGGEARVQADDVGEVDGQEDGTHHPAAGQAPVPRAVDQVLPEVVLFHLITPGRRARFFSSRSRTRWWRLRVKG